VHATLTLTSGNLDIQTICHTVPGYTKEVHNPETRDLYPISCSQSGK